VLKSLHARWREIIRQTHAVCNRFSIPLTSLSASKPHTRRAASSASKMSTIRMYTYIFQHAHMLPNVLVYSVLCLVLESSASVCSFEAKMEISKTPWRFLCVWRSHTSRCLNKISTSQAHHSFCFAAAARCMYNYCVVYVCVCALDLTFSQLANGKEDVVGLTHSLSEGLTPTLNKTSYNANLSMNLAWADVRSAWKLYIYL
jgi:hypothetical protein